MYAGCVAGALQKEVYLEIIKLNGFENITLQKEKPIVIPDDILLNYLSAEEILAPVIGAILAIPLWKYLTSKNQTSK